MTPNTVPLHIKFQCLQNLCDLLYDEIYNEIHTIKSKIKHGKQVEQLPCSNDMLQPMFAGRAKFQWQGNKNKTGSLDGVSNSMEE